MKAPALAYAKPSSLPEVFELLERYGDEAKLLAGGQSLIPTLNMRLSSPALLIDINGLGDLSGIAVQGDTLRIGALTRHCELAQSPEIARHAPLIAQAMPHIGHAAIRSRGTFGGSLAFADPAAELPACSVALDAQLVLASRAGERRIAAREFFTSLYTTAINPGEVLVAGEFPLSEGPVRSVFLELVRRRGDYAVVGLAMQAAFEGGRFSNVSIVFFGVAATPVLARTVAGTIEGNAFSDDLLVAAQDAVGRDVAPGDGLYESSAAVLHLAKVLLGRGIVKLASEEEKSNPPSSPTPGSRSGAPPGLPRGEGRVQEPLSPRERGGSEGRVLAEPHDRIDLTMTVNGAPVTARVPARRHLADFLREDLGLTGTHLGCEHGVCGACTVLVDGEMVRGCLMLAAQADGTRVETIEGLTERKALTDLQQAFHERNAAQCGFCSPAMLITAADLVGRNPSATRDEIRDHISGNYCRCTGYQAIVDAISAVCEQRLLAHGSLRGTTVAAPDQRSAIRGTKQSRCERSTNYIGAPLPRVAAKRLLAGRGQYVDDVSLPRTAHAAFLRSPYAHARIARIDVEGARSAKGVLAVLTGAEVAKIVDPYVGVLSHIKGMRSAPQYPLAVDCARWQGEPVAIVVAESRAQAEDALQWIAVDWEELPAVTDPETALEDGTTVIHPELGSNLCHERLVDSGGVDEAFARAAHVIEAEFETSRHTAVSLEPRTILADYDPSENQLTVWHSTQAPYMMQWILARHFRVPETNVRVIAPDVGGSFGLKIHIYGDEMAAVAAALTLGRPVKFVSDRLESFVADSHARGHRVKARIALSKAGDILAVDADDLYGIGPYAIYPRGGINEGMQISNLIAAPYRVGAYRVRVRAAFQNKAMYGQYRAVGHPIACTVTEGLIDLAADAVGADPADYRRRHYLGADAYPHKLTGGLVFEKLSQHEALEKLLAMMRYAELREEQARSRKRQVYRGIGLASFVENSNSSSATYGLGGASIAAQDACTIKLTATGGLAVASSLTEFGQGAHAVAMQIAASAVGVPIERVKVTLGDTQSTPYGGGNWGSRGTGIGGEAVLQTGRALRANILALVARLMESEASLLDIRDGNVVDAASGSLRMTLEDVARTVYFRTDQVPLDSQPELTVTRSYAQKIYPGIYTNGIHASHLEVDVETGFVTLLRHWVVDDSGTVVNPLLVDEQLRGGVVQGLGAALFEQCIYSAEGQLMNGSLVDYLVPMACEMPDIEVGHTCTPTATSALGAKGAGEAGTAGAAAAVMNAINDALKPFAARVSQMPFTPERILRALGSVSDFRDRENRD